MMKNKRTHGADKVATADWTEEQIRKINARAAKTKPEPFAMQVAAFLVDLIADIEWLMDDRNVTQAELARQLNVSEARISKLLNGNNHAANMTASTIARIYAALGEQAEVTSARLKELKDAVAQKYKTRDWDRFFSCKHDPSGPWFGNDNPRTSIQPTSRPPQPEWRREAQKANNVDDDLVAA